jgi:hypothetical protein
MQFTEILQAINRITASYKIIQFEKDPCATNIPFTPTATITPSLYMGGISTRHLISCRHRDPNRDPIISFEPIYYT